MAALLGGSLATLVHGCATPGEGVPPPADEVYFPVGLAIDAGAEYLYVVNSDFDLQFNQGTVQSLSLEKIRAVTPTPCSDDGDCDSGQSCDTTPTEENGEIPSFFCVADDGPHAGEPCGAFQESSATRRALSPGRCSPISLTNPADGSGPLIEDSVEISAFATDVIFRSRPDASGAGGAGGAPVSSGAPGRLFIPVRGDSSLHWIDVDSGEMDCGQQQNHGRCDSEHRVGDNPEADNTRGIEMPPEPFGIAATPDGRVIVTTHQTEGKVSVVLNDWNQAPRLEFVESGLPSRPIGVATVPGVSPVEVGDLTSSAGFLVTFRNAAQVNLLRFVEDAGTVARPFLVDVGSSPITINSLGYDSRGIAIDDSRREEARSECAAGDEDCLRAADETPLAVYVANRTPPSLLIGSTETATDTTAASDLPTFHDNVPLTAGPSRVLVGFVTNPQGELERRIFVLCFDSALIFVYDPARRRIETQIFTGRGPQAMAFDSERGVAYVGHFTDSYIGVVSLDQRHPETFGSMLASLGVPTPPRASK